MDYELNIGQNYVHSFRVHVKNEYLIFCKYSSMLNEVLDFITINLIYCEYPLMGYVILCLTVGPHRSNILLYLCICVQYSNDVLVFIYICTL